MNELLVGLAVAVLSFGLARFFQNKDKDKEFAEKLESRLDSLEAGSVARHEKILSKHEKTNFNLEIVSQRLLEYSTIQDRMVENIQNHEKRLTVLEVQNGK